jgi:hypothetical protein
MSFDLGLLRREYQDSDKRLAVYFIISPSIKPLNMECDWCQPFTRSHNHHVFVKLETLIIQPLSFPKLLVTDDERIEQFRGLVCIGRGHKKRQIERNVHFPILSVRIPMGS